MELSKDESMLSTDPDTKGFYLALGNNWIYPLNYEFREYQHNITKNAIFSNTLVCLPTGLGKTLIAAVIINNFWRWYPQGKIVFMAPTKPLVAQQISACHDIMGIPVSSTIELTGSMNPKNRRVAWLTKRVIFATPQIFQNDLEKDIAPAESVKCVVIDEAHKALGKHSYCESLRLLKAKNSCFRVLALSATPGSKVEDVCQVIKNLFISNLELRDETSPDIIPYLNKRHMDIILVPLSDDLARFKERYVSIMDLHVRRLVQYNVVKGDASTLSKGRIFYIFKDFQSKTNKPGNYGQIMKTLSRCVSLYHAYELLIRHGLRAFATFCQSHSADIWMSDEPTLQDLIKEIQTFLGPFPNVLPLPDGSIQEIPKDLVFGHTKFHKLKSLLSEHFEKFAAKNEETRAIVFVEYRDSVNEVYILLLQLRPMLRPKIFVGQSGQKRKQQMQAMEAFRNNEANVLISTSVGEEGLDVGEVDLIVCFDISQSSPIRLVQRMGRTGRRRDGRIVMLVTDGKEHQSLKSTIAKKDSLNNKILHSSNVISALYQESPRMVPPDINPVCSKMSIASRSEVPAVENKRKRKHKEDEPQHECTTKATVAKTNAVLPSATEKTKSMQSSMLQFLNKPSTSKRSNEVSGEVSQYTQTNQFCVQNSRSEAIKLLTSDTAAIEFLTLCAIRASKSDVMKTESNRMDETYLPTSSNDDYDNFFLYPVPSLDILDCLSHLEKRIELQSSELIEKSESEEIYNDVYVPEYNQCDTVEYQDINNLPAVGKFYYEDLFEDSYQLDETAPLDDQKGNMLDHNLKVLSENQESQKCQSNDNSNYAKERLSQEHKTIDGNHYEVSLKDDHVEELIISERLLSQPFNTDKQEFDKESNLLKVGCFESILDSSSDSEVPSSQNELDAQRFIEIRGVGRKNNAVSEKHNAGDIEKGINRPPTNSAEDAGTGSKNNIHPLLSKSLKSVSNNLHPVNSDITETIKPNVKQNRTNNCSDVYKPFHYNARRASCFSNISHESVKVKTATDTGTRLLTTKHNKYLRNQVSDSGIGFNFETEVPATPCKPVDKVINKITKSNESLDEHFAKPQHDDDDDDVIFVGELSTIARDNERREKFIDEKFSDDDDDVVFDKEVSFGVSKEANKSDANCSKSTITQILELIENSTTQKLNLRKINKDTQNLSSSTEPKSSTASTTVQAKQEISWHDRKVPNDQSDSSAPCTSNYFDKKDNIVKTSNISRRTEKLSDELDLSDIDWDDDFADDKQYNKDTKETGVQLHSNIVQTRTDNRETNSLYKKEISFITDSDSSDIFLENISQTTKSITDMNKTRLMNDKKRSLKSNSDSSGLLFQTNMQTQKSSPMKIMDLDLGDYAWDSDFEDPRNPIASLQQFGNSNNISSPNKSNDPTTSGLACNKSSSATTEVMPGSSSVAQMKKKLSLKERQILKPSTSKDVASDDDFDFEMNFSRKFDGKSGNDHHPATNYALITNNTLKSKLLSHEKENVEPNSGFTYLSSFSANRKAKDIKKVPFSRRVTIDSKKEVVSLDRDVHKRRKSRHRDRITSDFLDNEAEVSSDTSSGTSGEDDDLDGFVSHTQHEPVTADMQAHYLQSLKDVYNRNGFCLKKPRNFVPDHEVFSQPMTQNDESAYIHDSFCVSGGEDNLSIETIEESFLESTEKKFNNKKRKRSENQKQSLKKKQKVAARLSDSDSSDDETEELRKQIFEESMILKRNKKS